MRKFQVPVKRHLPVLVLALLVLLLSGSLLMRRLVLQKAIDAINNRLRMHQYAVHWDGVRIRGLNTVYVKGIYFQGREDNNELFLDSVSARIRIFPLLVRRIRIRQLECRTVSARYHAERKALVKTRAAQGRSAVRSEKAAQTDMAEMASGYIRRLFSYTPANARINRVQIRISSAGSPTLIAIHGFQLAQGHITALVVLAGEELRTEIPVKGRFDRSASIVEFHMVHPYSSLLPVPLLREKYGISLGFDTLSGKVDLSDRHRHLLNAGGEFSFAGFILNGERFSTGDIRLDHFWSSFTLRLTPDHIELDSASRVIMNKIEILPYLNLAMKKDPEIRFKLRPVNWDAGSFFASLPPGMFTSLTGLKASGKLHFHLDFSVDLGQPDSLLFDTKLQANDFEIISFGTDDYRKLNGSFYHQVYERGKPVASFMVGEGNPDFVSYDQISPYLRAAVMTSEDGSFFFHKGFNPRAFRESIAANLRERRFARGGSTISMQLVKNVFLTRNKTLARKIEEALIVWLIENQRLVPKQRMYEVYLNIIEWGPGIYGINQAAGFYFNKTPAALNLTESIYLASIVPRPKWYKYTFMTDGVTKPFFTVYFNRLKELMVQKDFITPRDTLGVRPMVQLTGPAALVFSLPDTVGMDSVIMDEVEILPHL